MIRRLIYVLVWTVWWIPVFVSAVLALPILLVWMLVHWIVKGEELVNTYPDTIIGWVYLLPDMILKNKQNK